MRQFCIGMAFTFNLIASAGALLGSSEGWFIGTVANSIFWAILALVWTKREEKI